MVKINLRLLYNLNKFQYIRRMKSLYIHIPFCKSKCNYCGFTSSNCFTDQLISSYLDTLIIDLESYGKVHIDTIYIGGGTPSVVSANMLSLFIDQMMQLIIYSGVEWTVEANPESLTIDHIKLFKAVGVSRISLGVQSSDQKVLDYLGRIHNHQDVEKAVANIRKYHSLCEINLDLIYDIPKVSISSIKSSLNDIMSLAPDHISAYSYSFDTSFLNKYVDIEISEEQYIMVTSALALNRYEQYEVSNFAKNKKVSLHNINYWQMGEYIGLGSGAHSMRSTAEGLRCRYSKSTEIQCYIENPLIRIEENIVDLIDMFKESIVFGLRMKSGIDMVVLKNEFDNLSDELLNKCSLLFDNDLIEMRGNNLCTTEKGFLLLESLSEYVWALEF